MKGQSLNLSKDHTQTKSFPVSLKSTIINNKYFIGQKGVISPQIDITGYFSKGNNNLWI